MSELDLIRCALKDAGGDDDLNRTDTAHFVLEGMSVLGLQEVPGIRLEGEDRDGVYHTRITIEAGAIIERPVKLCIGVLGEEGSQRLDITVEAGAGSRAELVAHCIFPSARRVLHAMDASVHVAEGASLSYAEHHFHGPYGGAHVIPKSVITLDEGARYEAMFSLLEGRVGRLLMDYEVRAGRGAVVELSARVLGRGDDAISIREFVSLDGEGARGMVKARIALTGNARAEVTGGTAGNAAHCRGHVDCIEIVRDNAYARAVPIVSVSHPEAKVTHEAAIGSVDQRQMETLMAHGLSPDQAVDMIITGMLGGHVTDRIKPD